MIKLQFLLLLFCGTVVAQNPLVPYEKLEFENYTEIWSDVTVDSTIIDNIKYDGRHHFFQWHQSLVPVEKGDFVFTVDMGGLYGIEGGLVQKRNKNTGEILWKKTFDRRSSDKHEWPQKIFIDDDNLLNVISYRTTESFPQTDYIFIVFHKPVSWSIRKYDINSGDLVNHFFSTENEVVFSSDENTNFLFNSNDGYVYLERSFTEIDEYYVKHIFDNELNLISSSDTIPLNLPDVFGDILVGGVLKYKDIACSFDVKNGTVGKPRHYSLLFWDENFNVIDSIKTSVFESLFNEVPSRFYLDYFDNEKIIIRTAKFDGNEFLYSGYIIDYDGNLIRKYNYPKKNGFDVSFFHMSYDTLNNCPIIITSERADSFYLIFYNVCDSTSQYLKLKTSPNNIAVSPINISILSNGALLASIHQGKDTILNNVRRIVSQGTIWLAIDGKIFELPTKVNENEEPSYSSIKLFPNPSNGLIKFESDSSFDKVAIYSIQGQLVKSFTPDRNEIDITELATGTYIVQFSNAQSMISHKILKQ